MHGNGLISKKTARAYSGGIEWIQGNVGLFSYVLPKAGDSLTFKEGINSASYGTSTKHTYMSLVRKGSNTGFVGLLYPSPDRTYPRVSKLANMDVMKLQKDDWKAFAFVNQDNNVPASVINSEEQLNIQTDASKFFIKYMNGNKYIFADDVSIIILDGKQIFGSKTPTTISIIYEGNTIKVYYLDTGTAYFYEDADNVVYNGEQRDDLYNGESIAL
jgi:hypothetical protein